jgi:hypothetical protein
LAPDDLAPRFEQPAFVLTREAPDLPVAAISAWQREPFPCPTPFFIEEHPPVAKRHAVAIVLCQGKRSLSHRNASAANLKFLQQLPQARLRTFKFKAALRS